MIRMRYLTLAILSALPLAFDINAWAVTMTTGAGSAVSVVDGTANFDPANSLFDNPYFEGSMAFSRTGLSFNNNGCGYAGCSPGPSNVGFPAFSGNYMYGGSGGPGTSGYFDIMTTGGRVFHGLEFVIGTGFPVGFGQDVAWQAFRSNVLVGSGDVFLTSGTIVGFSDAIGFDTLRYTSNDGFGSSPAFDSVRGEFGVVATPLPATVPLFATGLGLLGLLGWRRKRKGCG